MQSSTALDDVVDLDRYAIDDLDGARGRTLVAACRRDLDSLGVCQLHGFLTADAVAAMVRHEHLLREHAWPTDQTHTVYFEPPVAVLDAMHPSRFVVRSAKKAIAYDLIDEAAPIRRLYESDEMTRFVAAVLGKETLHRSADPLDALEIAVFEDGDELGWHFDRSEFSVTVMFQQSDAGGHFDYHPGLRSDRDANEPAVRAALHDTTPDRRPIRLETSPGTMAVFCGRHALHRVTKVAGSMPRINSVLTYGEQPGMRLNELTQRLFYGRTA